MTVNGHIAALVALTSMDGCSIWQQRSLYACCDRCVCYFILVRMISTHFTFSLPFDGVSNFQTDIFRVSWYLRFTFITDIQPPTPDSSWSFLPAPSTTKAEALHWNLPLTVLPHAYEDDTRRQTNSKTIFITPQGVI